MRIQFRHVVALSVFVYTIAGVHAQDARAEAEIRRALVLRQTGDYEEAVVHLKRAVALAPKMVKAHLTLATLSGEMCNSGSEQRDACELAASEYEAVLRLDGSHPAALKSLAYVNYQFARLEESERQYRKALALDGTDAEALCAVGAIDFERSFQDLTSAKIRHNLDAHAPFFKSPACPQVRSRNIAQINEGMELLEKSLETSPMNLDVLGHLSALYSVRADVQCSDEKAYESDMQAARRLDKRRAVAMNAKVRDFFEKCPPGPPPMPSDWR